MELSPKPSCYLQGRFPHILGASLPHPGSYLMLPPERLHLLSPSPASASLERGNVGWFLDASLD